MRGFSRRRAKDVRLRRSVPADVLDRDTQRLRQRRPSPTASASRTTQSTTSPTRPRPRCRTPRSIRKLTYDYAYTYPAPAPAPGVAQPHGPTAIGPFTISHDANANQITTLETATTTKSQYL